MQTLPYNPQLLHLAANIPLLGRLEKPDATARAISRLCGSWLEVDIKLDNGRIQDFRQRLEACALGQASAAILGQNIPGASPQEIRQAYKVFKTMLKEKGPPPKGRFQDLAMLAEVHDYPQRYTSTLLPFTALLEALDKLSEDT